MNYFNDFQEANIYLYTRSAKRLILATSKWVSKIVDFKRLTYWCSLILAASLKGKNMPQMWSIFFPLMVAPFPRC